MEVKYGKDRAFFEAGTAFNPSFDIFDGSVLKKDNLINDYIWTEEIPKIDGIYCSDLLNEKFHLSPADQYDGKQAFFISHLHLDHMRMMGLIDKSIPVYLTRNAQIIESALEDVGLGVDTYRGEDYLDMQEDTYIGNIHVHRFVLNDDSYQDLSFYIETPDLKIHYTGDIFVYGKYFDNIKKEIAYINEKGVDILVHEGTTFWGGEEICDISPSWHVDKLLSYDEYVDRFIETVNRHSDLVVFNHYEREMSDVMMLEKVAEECNRTLVFEPESAHIINKFFNKPVNICIPDTYFKKPEYLNDIIACNNVIASEEIIRDKHKYMLQNTYQNMLELMNYRDMNTLYIHISGTPIGEFDPKYQNMLKILDRFNIEFKKIGQYEDGSFFSSHACKQQVLQYLEEVNASLYAPVHTANRKFIYHNIRKPKFYLELNKTYIYDRDNNTLEVTDYEQD